MIPEQSICPYRVVHIMGAFFTAFDFPCLNRRNRPKDFNQDIKADILAGKKTILRAFLCVKPPAGLNALSSQAAFAPKKTAPVASAGNSVTQSAVNENFQANVFRTGEALQKIQPAGPARSAPNPE